MRAFPWEVTFEDLEVTLRRDHMERLGGEVGWSQVSEQYSALLQRRLTVRCN